jgi:phosphatidylserine decarboxylase
MSLGIETSHGRVLVRQIAGLVARRIVTDGQIGDRAAQGERMGLIRFGSRVDTFVPPSARTLVAVGDRARAGVTPLLEWDA